MDDDLRVPKRRIAVDVLLAGGTARQFAFFLADLAPDHPGSESVSDLLNGTSDFIPGLDIKGDSTFLLNRGMIALVRVAREVEQNGPPGDGGLQQQHEVIVTLLDGSEHHGLVTFVMPPGQTRLLDFLNSNPGFFPLDPGPGTQSISLINKRHVSHIATNRSQ